MRNRTCAWAPPWIPLLCQQTRGTVWLKRHDRMIDRAGPFIKPCAFGAPQAALGLAERSCPVARVCRVITAVSSMPHYCRSPQAQELFWTGSKKFLTKGASYKPAHDVERKWNRAVSAIGHPARHVAEFPCIGQKTTCIRCPANAALQT